MGLADYIQSLRRLFRMDKPENIVRTVVEKLSNSTDSIRSNIWEISPNISYTNVREVQYNIMCTCTRVIR